MGSDNKTRYRKGKGKKKDDADEFEENDAISSISANAFESKKPSKKYSDPKIGSDTGSSLIAQIIFVILLLALTVILALIAIELQIKVDKDSQMDKKDKVIDSIPKHDTSKEKESSTKEKEQTPPVKVETSKKETRESHVPIEEIREETPPLEDFVKPNIVKEEPVIIPEKEEVIVEEIIEEEDSTKQKVEAPVTKDESPKDVEVETSTPAIIEEVPIEDATEVIEESVEEPKESIEEPKESIEEPKVLVEEPTEPVEEPKEIVEEPTEPVDFQNDQPIEDLNTIEAAELVAEEIEKHDIPPTDKPVEIEDLETDKSSSSAPEESKATEIPSKLMTLYLAVESMAEEIVNLDPANSMIAEVAPHMEGILKSMEAGKFDGIEEALNHIQTIFMDIKERIELGLPIEEKENVIDVDIPTPKKEEELKEIDEVIPDPVYIHPRGDDEMKEEAKGETKKEDLKEEAKIEEVKEETKENEAKKVKEEIKKEEVEEKPKKDEIKKETAPSEPYENADITSKIDDAIRDKLDEADNLVDKES